MQDVTFLCKKELNILVNQQCACLILQYLASLTLLPDKVAFSQIIGGALVCCVLFITQPADVPCGNEP